jgi:DNA-binding IclR family transcriptional regulator
LLEVFVLCCFELGVKEIREVSSVSGLDIDVKRVCQQGYAVAQEELEIGLSAVAGPIWNCEGEVVAAVSVSGPSFHLSSAKIPELAAVAKQVANEISHQLGYVG